MPTYDYICENCDHEFEQSQSITARPLVKCPKCGRMKLKRLIGAGSGVIFKGSGFYQTDYRSESYKQGAKKDKKTVKAETDSSKKQAAPNSSPAAAKTQKKTKNTKKPA